MMAKQLHPILFSFSVLLISCQRAVPEYILSETIPSVDQTREARMLSAFFGLDNALTPNARLIWREAPRKYGLPLVFSHEIDPQTLDASDFQIKTQQGDIRGVEFVSYQPAIEEFELSLLLLIGEFGESPDNDPIEVEIISELKSRDKDIELVVTRSGSIDKK